MLNLRLESHVFLEFTNFFSSFPFISLNVYNTCSSDILVTETQIFLVKVADDFYSSIQGKKPEKVKIIVSSHNYQNTPSAEEIGNLVARIQATGADIVKVATTALDITDSASIFQVLVRSQVSGQTHCFDVHKIKVYFLL